MVSQPPTPGSVAVSDRGRVRPIWTSSPVDLKTTRLTLNRDLRLESSKRETSARQQSTHYRTEGTRSTKRTMQPSCILLWRLHCAISSREFGSRISAP